MKEESQGREKGGKDESYRRRKGRKEERLEAEEGKKEVKEGSQGCNGKKEGRK